ncbi:MAG: hypothetical protein A2Y38_02450 [Spirochaetes bacterium GWB1_59_5]|nr:MAG: hypothetical protein A2Y38_02450 [Spirochaetes bacterium GWB1_59_5]
MKTGKTLRVTCKGAATAPLKDLHPLQGNLKKLPEKKYRKLRKTLLKHGFSFPFFVWRNKNKLWILDGHQRDKVLRRMQKSGYEIPSLPIDFIEAKDEKEAKEKILLVASQYGEMDADSLSEFLEDAHLDLEDLVETVDLPTIDIEKLLNEAEEKEKKDKSLAYQYQIIVDCENEEQQLKLLEKLEKEKYKCRALIL